MSYSTRVLVAGVCLLIIGCGYEAKRSSISATPPREVNKAGVPVHAPRIGAAVNAADVWPVPRNVVRTAGGVRTTEIHPGSGAVHSERGVALALAFARYNRQGQVINYTPMKLLALEHVEKRWREVYEMMVPGEVRRVWFEDASGSVAIYDVELLGYVDLRSRK